MKEKTIEEFCPSNQQEWRQWLQTNHVDKDAVWLIFYKKKAQIPTITWSQSVDEALCFGWIDSVKKTIDETKYIQYFSKRKANSIWSKINKDKVELLIKEGLMTDAGLQCIEIAKQNGSWTILDEVENLAIPKDLDQELKKTTGAMDYFLSLSKSARKSLLQWVILAKRPETRQKRITDIVESAGQKRKPKAFS
ncbi:MULTISPECIES: YdeI/OmpD-associated family protein [Reichenbachiella]|uniref:Uncharacterized conserved protein YdeI, YjbR/CyaY-like superfamily, DUF1801 family n=1 Tax=Reichenbachiella agariperforans TaxID=156994 RepID=A0A1M6Q6P0_REIAG|nr:MULTISPECIES: YdeI/OmpD-associated family protein [Reichenbachiella]MBU2914243.1 YdeI/OmpD-associated family protein [Reichenbachiella agariperforans]RJE72974.1 hypothetical protein BGP76_03240 [Reichenbachiella sp. MSK19-1]SHK15871.1 Uncharacterized conserved protein YdeI, YjbR/CyaY-like superfamily, DUF1801 family [Reichenbachiella agariperforans]